MKLPLESYNLPIVKASNLADLTLQEVDCLTPVYTHDGKIEFEGNAIPICNKHETAFHFINNAVNPSIVESVDCEFDRQTFIYFYKRYKYTEPTWQKPIWIIQHDGIVYQIENDIANKSERCFLKPYTDLLRTKKRTVFLIHCMSSLIIRHS